MVIIFTTRRYKGHKGKDLKTLVSFVVKEFSSSIKPTRKSCTPNARFSSAHPVLDSQIMYAEKSHFRVIWIIALLCSTLACRAATRLVIPDTPTPLPTFTPTVTATLTPTPLPTFTPTVIFAAACPSVVEGILDTVTAEVNLTGKESDQLHQEEGGIFLVTYDVAEDQISDPHFEAVPDELEDERDDRSTHEAIWKYFVSIIPPAEREFVVEFSIFTDGTGNHLAAVSPVFSDPEQWHLRVDILDAANYYDLTYTLLHEQGHLLTLNSKQVPPSKAIFEFPENETVLKQEMAACPQYFTGQGCSEPASYLNQFFDRFWPYIFEEWEQIELERDKDERDALLEDFYRLHKDQFVSDYAPTSPMEDIAESWAFFVLSPKPEISSIASEKILFFYEYPELVELRTQILQEICVAFPQ